MRLGHRSASGCRCLSLGSPFQLMVCMLPLNSLIQPTPSSAAAREHAYHPSAIQAQLLIRAALYRAWYTNKTVGATNPDDFFVNPTTISYYLANAQNIMTRVNTITKVAYNQDPTIMAWDL